MVGRAVALHCAAAGDEVLSFERRQLDIAHGSEVRAALEAARPETIINCAAWTDVDGCELDPLHAREANALGPENLAAAAREVGASLVHISTDYVFDGRKEGFYTQRDDPHPESVYAVSKLEGERRAAIASARTVIVRTGWIFGQGGRNFLSRVGELAARKERLKAISDAYGTPTFAADLAARLRELAALDLPGIYHVVNSGEGASFSEFTRAVLELTGEDGAGVEEVSMSALARPAPRPRNSRLRCLLSEAVGLRPLPDWREALGRFLSA